MKEYDIKITEVLEKTVQVQAESREAAEAIASENWNHSMYDMDSAEDYADVSFQAGEERDISPPVLMKVLLVKPGEYPKPIQIGTELGDLQQAVGGYIQCVYPYDEPVGIICNEEGKLNGAVLNRALYGEEGELQDIIAGNFLVVGLTEESFGSLTDVQMKQYEAKFHHPETFVKMGKSIMVLPVPEEQVKRTISRQMDRENSGKEKSLKEDHKVPRRPTGREK